MSWNRTNWKTTVTGGLSAAGMALGMFFPPAKPIADGLSMIALALFAIFAADANTGS